MSTDRENTPGAVGPNDLASSTEVLRRMEANGFGVQFMPGGEPATLRCAACRSTSPASSFDIDEERRLEGASDPDDMVLVVAATCPVCGAKGTVVLGYGPDASMEDSDVVLALERRPEG